MANVFFKRGSHASLPASGTAAVTDGTFYLTTDTHRLYVGQGQNLIELNKSITSVQTMDELTSNSSTVPKAAGQFYYVSADNVLAYYNGSGWIQINPDTRLEDTTQNTAVTSASNAATITSDVAEDLGAQSHHSIGSFTIKGGTNNSGDNLLNVTVSGNEITLTPNIENLTSDVNTTYSIGTSGTATTGTVTANGSVNINLDASGSATDSHITVQGANAATVTQASDVITIDVANPIATTEAEFDENGVLTIDTSVNGNTSNPDTVTPIIMLGGTANDNLDSNGYKFVNGIATLPVYTKKQTEERINAALGAADAMTYKGVVGTGSNQTEANADATTKLVSTANAGDTYKVYQTITTPVAANAGDLVIAEGSDGTVTWIVVPSGDDQAVVGEVGELSFEISDGSGELAGATFAAGTHMAVTGTANGTTDTHTTITIAQAADYTAQTAAGSNAAVTQNAGGKNASTATFTAVTAIQTDAYGNVVNGSIQTQTLTVTDTHNKVTEIEADTSVDTTNNVGTISINASDDDQNDITAGEFTISSTGKSITLTETASGINAEIVWGTF